ncbi:MAG: EamA family transporter [Glaciecola sp.]
MKNNHTVFKGMLAIIVASLLWGTTGTAASYAPNVSALGIGAFSMGIGGVLLVLAARRQLFIDYKRILQHPWVLLLGAASVAIYPLAFYSSMRLSGVAIGTVVSIASAPFFAAVLERVISNKAISIQWILSFVIGAVGIALLALGKVDNVEVAYNVQAQTLGIVLGCVAGLTYAGYSYAAKRLIEAGVHSTSSMSAMFGIAAMFLLPSLLFTGDNLFSSATNTSVSLYMAIVPMFIGYLLFGFGLNYVDASKATLITLIEPVIATILAVLIVGEQFTGIGAVGILLVMVCLLMQAVKKNG